MLIGDLRAIKRVPTQVLAVGTPAVPSYLSMKRVRGCDGVPRRVTWLLRGVGFVAVFVAGSLLCAARVDAVRVGRAARRCRRGSMALGATGRPCAGHPRPRGHVGCADEVGGARCVRAAARCRSAADRSAIASLWLSGLLEAPSLAGPFVRASAPAGTASVLALVAADGAVHVGTPQGLLEAIPGPRTASTDGAAAQPASFRPALPDDPSVQQVYRAALRWLDLGPERMRELQRGVDRRGLLPELSIGLGQGSSRQRGWDTDESFGSGDTRRLFDSDRTRGEDFEAKIELRWDLGALAYHDEAIDVSHEAREVIELRDDVLDEIAQLYFERRRTLLEHALLDASAGLERERLRLRADELAAGLDAWTGGWFSRHAPSPAPDPISPPNPEGVLPHDR